MMRSVKIRPCVCVLAVVFHCAPMIAIGAPGVSRDCTTEIRALAAPASIVLCARADGRQDYPRRSCTPFFRIPLPMRGREPDLVCLALATKRAAPPSVFAAGPRTGRSPPALS